MIGVIAEAAEHEIVREFFELFKTPWEFCCSDRRYDVVLCAGDGPFDQLAKVVLCYAGRRTHFDGARNIPRGGHQGHPRILSYKGNRVPVYGDAVTFPEKGNSLLVDNESQQCVAYLDQFGDRLLVRIGYDLFGEVRMLLEVGQPPANASMPALDLHIDFLRDLITRCGVPLAEIPPVPEGYRFIACLTHDVDHPSIRRHKWDHTALGFLYRAVFGSFCSLIRGRLPVRSLLRNWLAVLKIPFVHLGIARDFWSDFDDRYRELEKGIPSTFFVIPFENYAGRKVDGDAPRFRAARYGAQDIASAIQKLAGAGCEIGLHGIDAWLDSDMGSQEMAEIQRLAGNPEVGVRMHWLYYDENSPATLEKAGVAYDSTIGYNETVGYRAGTTQAYRPVKTDQLLELPLHVMDTALFYPGHLGLSSREAKTLVGEIVDHAVKCGGCLTINWHDRSTAPERLWDGSYRELLQDLKGRGAWFATARQAVSWFRKRRSAVFESDSIEPGGAHATVRCDFGGELPRLRLRFHIHRGASTSQHYVDQTIDEAVDVPNSLGVVG